MKKRLSNFFYVLSTDLGLWIFWIIFSILWTGVFFKMGIRANLFEPPTEANYQWLHEQENRLEQDFENVYLIEGARIKIQDSNIVVTLTSRENKDYELEIIFDLNKEKMKSKEICLKEGYRTDPIYPKLEKHGPKIQFILLGMMTGGASAVGVSFLYQFVYKAIEKRKKKVR